MVFFGVFIYLKADAPVLSWSLQKVGTDSASVGLFSLSGTRRLHEEPVSAVHVIRVRSDQLGN